MIAKRLTCDDYRRMPVNEEVLDHIRSCESCRTLFEQLAEGKYKAERRN
jgi:predicted anti-sigma-YlaC factor YlaD